MITYIAVIGIILIVALNINLIFKSVLPEAILIAIFIIILWIIGFGYLNQMWVGSLLLFPTFTLLLFYQIRTKQKAFEALQSIKQSAAPITFFVFLSAWDFWHSQQMKFSQWDEFTRWGIAVKGMFYFDEISPPVPNGKTVPGLAVLPYLITKIGGNWEEADTFWAYHLIIFAIFIAVLGNFKFKQIGKSLVIFTLLILTSILFYSTFLTVYADPILSLLFGYAIYLACRKKYIIFDHFLLFTTLAVITLIKDIGFFFALIVTGIYVLSEILNRKNNGYDREKNSIGKLIFKLSIPFFVIFLTNYSWKFHLAQKYNEDKVVIPTNQVLENQTIIQALFSPNDFSNQVISNMLETLKNGVIGFSGFPLGTLHWLFLASVFVFFIANFEKNAKQKSQEMTLALAITLGGIAYIFVLLVIYLTQYTGANSLGLTSFDRYMSTYLGGFFFYICIRIICMLKNFDQITNKKTYYLFGFFVFFLAFQSPQNYITDYINKPNRYSDDLRVNFNPIVEKIKFANIAPDKKVWIIAQHTMGFEFYILQYEILPSFVTDTGGTYPYSLGEPSGPGDVWTDTSMTPERWDEYLSETDYVVLFKVTESFVEQFGSFFENQDDISQSVYRVVHSPSGNKLVRFV